MPDFDESLLEEVPTESKDAAFDESLLVPVEATPERKPTSTISTYRPSLWQRIRPALTPLIGPSPEEELSEAVPMYEGGKLTSYQYKPMGSAIEREGFISGLSHPFVPIPEAPRFEGEVPLAAYPSMLASAAWNKIVRPLGETLESPLGTATAGAGPMGRRVAAGLFAGQVASQLPQMAKRAGEVSVTGTPQEKLEAGLETAGGVLLPAVLAKEAMSRQPLALPQSLRALAEELPAEELPAVAPQTILEEQPPTTEVTSALEDKTAAPLHEPVSAQPGESEQAVPTKEGGLRVPPSAEATGEIPLNVQQAADTWRKAEKAWRRAMRQDPPQREATEAAKIEAEGIFRDEAAKSGITQEQFDQLSAYARETETTTRPEPEEVSPTVQALRRELEQLQGGEITDATLARSAQIARELEALEKSQFGGPQTITVPEGEKAPDLPAQPAAGMTAEGGAIPPAVRPKRRRAVRERPFDIIDAIEGQIGKLSLSSAQKIREGFRPTGAARKLFTRSGGSGIDDALSNIQQTGMFRHLMSEDELLGAIEDAASSRKGFRKSTSVEQTEINRQQAQRVDFERAALEGRRTRSEPKQTESVKVGDLLEGDEFQLAGVKVKVKELVVDRETGEVAYVVLEDGRRFEVQTIGPDEIIQADKGTVVSKPQTSPAPPKLRPMEKQGDLLSTQQEPFKLAGETATDYQRIAAEKERIAKEKAEQEKQQQSLFGEGPGAAPRGFGPYPAVQQLTDQLNADAPVGAKERLSWGERKADLWAKGRGALARTLARARNVSEVYKGLRRGVRTPNDLDRRVGEYDWAIQQSSAMSNAMKRAIERQMPDVTNRNAAAVLMDSARIAADPRNPADMRQVIEDGLALMPSDTPAFVRRAFERALDPSLELRQFAESLKQFFGLREQDAVAADLFDGGLEDYYTHVWKKPENMPGAMRDAIANGRVTTYFQFARQRKLSSFVEGILEGKTPVLDPAEVLPFYNFSMDRAIAGRELIKRLGDLKASDGRPAVAALGDGDVADPGTSPPGTEPVVINPQVKEQRINDYMPVDNPALRRWKWLAKTPEGRDVLLRGNLVVHPEFHERLARFMDRARLTPSPGMRRALAVSGVVKQAKLSALPSLFHVVHVGSHGLLHWTNPFRTRAIDWESPRTRFAVEQGHLKLAADPRELSILAEGLATGDWVKKIPIMGKWSHAYSRWLFTDYIPRLKLATFENAMEGYRSGAIRSKLKLGRELRSGRLSEEEAAARIGDAVNNAYGELNHLFLNRLGRDPSFQRKLRLAFLAPDFGEARGRFVAKALTTYGTEERLAAVTLMATFWVGARVANWLSHGDPENDFKHAFQVKVGNKWFSMRSVAGDVVHAFEDPGQFTFVRLNPTFVRPAADFLYSRDQASGRKLDAGEKLKRIAETMLPIQLGNLTRDDQEFWESFTTSMGVSMRHDVPELEMSKLAQQWLKTQGRNPPAEFIATQEPGYQKLRLALRMDNDKLAGQVLDALRKTRSDKMIENAMAAHVDRPFTGTWEMEAIFQGTLTAKQRALYLAARQQELDELQRFYRVMAYHPRKE